GRHRPPFRFPLPGNQGPPQDKADWQGGAPGSCRESFYPQTRTRSSPRGDPFPAGGKDWSGWGLGELAVRALRTSQPLRVTPTSQPAPKEQQKETERGHTLAIRAQIRWFETQTIYLAIRERHRHKG